MWKEPLEKKGARVVGSKFIKGAKKSRINKVKNESEIAVVLLCYTLWECSSLTQALHTLVSFKGVITSNCFHLTTTQCCSEARLLSRSSWLFRLTPSLLRGKARREWLLLSSLNHQSCLQQLSHLKAAWVSFESLLTLVWARKVVVHKVSPEMPEISFSRRRKIAAVKALSMFADAIFQSRGWPIMVRTPLMDHTDEKIPLSSHHFHGGVREGCTLPSPMGVWQLWCRLRLREVP